ncbi:MAG: YesL family protein [Oscillospiraceae bacterium]|jgi:hypothetical protein|nr:YesL family protein [Oscillospiraceae bacterium]
MLGNFFNNFYYGKSGKKDFNPENLPQNRVQLFFDMLRVRWGALVKLNFLYLLFWLPALIWSVMSFVVVNDLTAQFLAEAITEDFFNDELYGAMFTWLLLMIPCIAITGPATAGVSFVTRNWARDQHSFVMSDFKDAFKANWKQALVVSGITSVAPLLVYVGYRFYSEMAATQSVLYTIPQMLLPIMGLIWLLMLQLLYTMMVTYDFGLGTLLRNAVILAVGKLPLSVGIRLAALALPIVCFALQFIAPSIGMYAVLVLALYYLLFGFAFHRFLYASYANAICEKYLNARIEGAPVGMGLRQTTEDDYEIDPTLPQPKPEDEQDDKP